MSKNIKGITIEIGGETTGLTKALKSVNSESRKTQSELNQVNKALKLDPHNTELVAQKQELLAKATAETKTKLNALKKAKEQADKDMANGTEVNSAQYRKLQREIVTAKSKVGSLENQTKELGTQTTRTLKNIGDKFDKAGQKITSVGKKMTKVSIGIGAGLVSLGVKSARSADDINTLAAQTGVSTEKIQKFKYAAERIDVPLETFTGSLKKLTKNMNDTKDGTGEAKDAFEALKVSVVDELTGELKSNQDVFDEVIDKLAEVENETQRDAYAMDIFGKSATDLNPLILAGADTLTQYGEEAEKAGLILSQDMLDGANEASDSIDKLKATVDASIDKVGASLAEVLTPILEKITEKIESVVKWFNELTDAQKETALKVTALVVAIGPALVILGKMFSAVKLVTTALTFLAAHPIVLAIAAIGALAAAVGLHIAKSKEETEEMKKAREEHEALVGPIEENIKKYDELKAAQKESTEKALEETEMTKALWQELQTLADENGNVKEADKDRAEFIVGELSDAMGQEIEMIDGQIQGYKDLQTEIDNYLSKRQGQILLEQGEESYTNAKTNLLPAKIESSRLEKNNADLEKQKAEIEKQIIAEMEAEKAASTVELSEEIEKELFEKGYENKLANNEEYQQLLGFLEDNNAKMQENNEMIDSYRKDIDKYTELQTAVATDDFGTINKQVSEWNIDILGTYEDNLNGLRDYVTEVGLAYYNLLAEHEKGNKEIKQEEINAAEELYSEAKTKYKEAGGVIPQALAEGIDENSDDVVEKTDLLKQYLLNWSDGIANFFDGDFGKSINNFVSSIGDKLKTNFASKIDINALSDEANKRDTENKKRYEITQNFYSPKSLTPAETARQNTKASQFWMLGGH